jgi:hypothetical protein
MSDKGIVDLKFWCSSTTDSQLAEPKPSRLKSARTLRLASWILHSTLVAIHVALIGIWARGLEHHLIFSLDTQKIVSLLITAISTAFGTVRSALFF